MTGFTATVMEPITREKVIEVMTEYLKTVGSDQKSGRAVCRHMHGLLTGLAGARKGEGH